MCLLAATVVLPALAQARITYCCNDDQGRQVCADVLPQACYNRAYREIDARGITIRHVPAPLTPEQRAAKEAADRQAKEEEARRREQERKDRALLATYASERDIEEARERAIGEARKSIKAAQDKQAELMQRQKKLDDETEFYKNKPIPPALKAQLGENEAALKAQQAAIEGKLREIEALEARFEEEKRRYRTLTQKTLRQPAAP
jgi:DNA repair exonuclease SbcCD ATPase subunit